MRKKSIICVVLLLAIMLSVLTVLSGCSEKTADEIFTKTIHDFDGHRVVNLDEREDTNFAVYTEKVQEIEITDSNNILVSADTENLSYTFANPDEQLRSVKPGDIFWAEASPKNPDGLAVKVKEIDASGEELVIYSEEVALEDLFTYVDIDMEVSLDSIYFDESQLEDGMEILVENNATAYHAVQPETTDEAQIVQLLNTTDEWSGTEAVQIVFKNKLDVAPGKSNDTAGGSIAGNMHFTAEHQMVIKQIRVRFKYSLEQRYFFADVSCDGEESVDYAVEFEGSWSNGSGGLGKTWPTFCVPIPYTPIKVSGELFQLTTLSGSMKGDFQQNSSFTMGACSNIQNLAKTEPEAYCTETGSSSKASLEFEGKIEVLFGVRLDAGVPFVADVFLETGIGPGLMGTLDTVIRNEEDCIHDCDRCLDGDVNLIIRTECGVDARLVSSITGYDLSVRKNLGEISTKLGDFYASYRQDAENGVECGWGECPYLRWKTTINVLTKEGETATDANVRAQYPDGRTALALTDNTGTAVLYLPNEDNRLSCSYQGARGSVNVPISGAPASVILRLDDERQIFICYLLSGYDGSRYEPTEYYELYSLLSEQYPDAVWISMDEWMSHTDANSPYQNYMLEGLQEAYGLSAGDIIIYPYAYKWDNHSARLNDEVYSFDGDFESINMQVGIALLPEETEDSKKSDTPEVIWLYGINIYLRSTGYYLDDVDIRYRYTTFYVSDIYFQCGESYWNGLEYGSDYRIKEIGTEWTNKEWQDSAPLYGATTMYDFYANISLYRPLLAEYVKRAFPYIELALDDEWDKLPEMVNEGGDTYASVSVIDGL